MNLHKSLGAVAPLLRLRRGAVSTFASVAIGGAGLTVGTSASAHHSFAMYDADRTVTLDGVVKDFQWSNPHALVWVLREVQGAPAPELWTVELPTSPAGLLRMGWDKRSLQPGDRVVMEIHPLRDGRHGGSFTRASLPATGKVLVVKLGAPLADAAGPDAAPAATGAATPTAVTR